MGGGSWDDDDYRESIRTRKIIGESGFTYDAAARTLSRSEQKAHPLLDPRQINRVRESRDSDEHPTSLAIAIIFDATGSMRKIPQVFQEQLGKLMDLLKKSGVKHPQIMVGAIGDYSCDAVPFQIGQFESDNRIDQQLRLFFLEGGGGGTLEESYGLAYYMAGWKTSLDCWEKRQKKGYLFTIGDENPYSSMSKEELSDVFGDKLKNEVTMQEAIQKASEKYEVFHIVASQGSNGNNPSMIQNWKNLLGPRRVLILEKPSDICELIVEVIAAREAENASATAPDKAESSKGTTADPDDKKKKKGRIF